MACSIILLFSLTARAWGPHGQITSAAIDRLGTNHVLVRQLGRELWALTNYCWIPDFKQLPFRAPEADFYADDYLLFPGMTRHLDHICPEVEQAYGPYFQRALQALRMESAANSARWIGALLHFIQDSGSPPHAARIRGSVHIKMENWIDATKIVLPGYTPRLLGTNEADAIRGLVERMSGVIETSRARGEKLRFPVLVARRKGVEPIVLESALECARLSADVLHTLGILGGQAPPGFELSGRIGSTLPMSPGRFPARLLVRGTNISTLADLSGRFALRGIAPGPLRLTILQPGSRTLTTNILVDRSMTYLVFTLAATGDLVPNSDFQSHWIATNMPDGWTRMNVTWESEVVALTDGRRYLVRADFLPDSEAEVVVRWSAMQPFVIPKPTRMPLTTTRRLTAEAPQFLLAGGTNAGLLQLSIRTAGDPTNELRRVAVKPIQD